MDTIHSAAPPPEPEPHGATQPIRLPAAQPATTAGACRTGPTAISGSVAAPTPFSTVTAATAAGSSGCFGSPGGWAGSSSFTAVSPASAAGAAACSPGAVLAASLVRCRASYFERVSSGARAPTSASASGSGSGAESTPAAVAAPPGSDAQPAPPTPRHSAMLAPHPLHPLAPHPLSRAGSGGSWHDGSESSSEEEDSDGSEDMEAVDTFFDRPSYMRYGNVEMSAATSYARSRHAPPQGAADGGDAARERPRPSGQPASSGCGPGPGDVGAAAAAAGQAGSSGCETASSDTAGAAAACSAGSPPSGPVAAAAAGSCASAGGADPGSPNSELAALGCRGYVRSVSARFGRVSGSGAGGGAGGGGGGRGGMDGLFDGLVAHVGALLACQPDAEAQMGMVQGLSDRLLALHQECERLERKEDEVEHLRGVLRELTATRAEAIRLKVQMAESLNGLQQEYYKVLRSAQLAQSTAKQAAARAAATRKQLGEAAAELGRHRAANAALRRRNRALRRENEELAGRLAGLERAALMGGADGRHSACYVALMRAQAGPLY